LPVNSQARDIFAYLQFCTGPRDNVAPEKAGAIQVRRPQGKELASP
jgi:hypothetical protein